MPRTQPGRRSTTSPTTVPMVRGRRGWAGSALATARCAVVGFVGCGAAVTGVLVFATNVFCGAVRSVALVARCRGVLLPLRAIAATVWLWGAGVLLAAVVCDVAGCGFAAGTSVVAVVAVAAGSDAGGSAGGAGVGGVAAGGAGTLPLPFPLPLPGPTGTDGREPSFGRCTSTLGTCTLSPPWPGGTLTVGTGTLAVATPSTSMTTSALAGATAAPANASPTRAI